jgi:hypothetical protein
VNLFDPAPTYQFFAPQGWQPVSPGADFGDLDGQFSPGDAEPPAADIDRWSDESGDPHRRRTQDRNRREQPPSVSDPTLRPRGFAWYVSPVGVSTGRAASPFDFGVPRACESPLRGRAYWPVGAESTGVRNADAALGFLVLTVMASPPAPGEGWAVEPARLDANCMADGGNLRVVSVTGTSPEGGADDPREYVFEGYER